MERRVGNMGKEIVVNKMDELITYNVTDAMLAEMKKTCLKLTVKDIDDRTGYRLCNNARSEVREKLSVITKP